MYTYQKTRKSLNNYVEASFDSENCILNAFSRTHLFNLTFFFLCCVLTVTRSRSGRESL